MGVMRKNVVPVLKATFSSIKYTILFLRRRTALEKLIVALDLVRFERATRLSKEYNVWQDCLIWLQFGRSVKDSHTTITISY